MKQFLRIFLVAGIIVLAILGTATSCGNTPSGGNNNSGGGGGGGDNPGGGNPGGGGGNPGSSEAAFGKMKFAMADYSGLAKIDATSNRMVINASKFPTTVAGAAGDNFGTVITGIAANPTEERTKKIFTVSLTGSTGGLLLVKGGKSEVNQFNTLPSAAWADDNTANRDIHVLPPTAEGLKIYSVFADKTTPADDVYAFAAGGDTQPIFYCVAVAPEVRSFTGDDAPNATLKGAQEADCYISSVGAAAAGNAWLSTTYKQSLKVTFAGIGTDDKAISAIGLTGTDDAANVAAFEDGINITEMGQITSANPDKSDSTEMTLQIVNADIFAATPVIGSSGSGGGGGQALTFTVTAGFSVKEVAGDKIMIKASEFPGNPAATATEHFNKVVENVAADANKAKKIFSVSLPGSAGGLLLANGGDTAINTFSIPDNFTTAWTDDAKYNKGIHGAPPVATGDDAGLKIYSVFADKDPRTGATDNIYAFATEGNTQPIFYCVATAPEVVNFTDPTDKLTGGQNADCYISSVGTAALGTGTDWLTATTGADYKRSFQATFAGIGTGDKTISDIGLTGDALKNGVDAAEMAAVLAVNPNNSSRRVMTLEIVNSQLFADTKSVDDIPDVDPNADKLYNGPLRFEVRPEQQESVEIIDDKNLVRIRIKPSIVPSRPKRTGVFYGSETEAQRSARTLGSLDKGFWDIDIAPTGRSGNLFDVYYEGTSAGLILFTKGEAYDANWREKFTSIPAFTGVPGDRNNYDPAGDDGFFVRPPDNNAGFTYEANFMNKLKPSAAQAGNPNSEPYAFSPSSDDNDLGAQPVVLCKSSAMLGLAHVNFDGSFKETSSFAGSQEATCVITAIGKREFTEKEVYDHWFAEADAQKVKTNFNITIMGINTGGDTIMDMGIPGPLSNVNYQITNGLSGQLFQNFVSKYANAGKVAIRRVSLEMVKPDQLPYNNAKIVINNFASGVARLKNGLTTVNGVALREIEINMDNLAPSGDSASITGAGTLADMTNAADSSVKKLFDLTLNGAYSDRPSTDGLVLVDIGTKDAFVNFEVKAPGVAPGVQSGIITHVSEAGANPIFGPAGMKFYSIFADPADPGANYANKLVDPFAFTKKDSTQPILACRSVISSITTTDSAATTGKAVYDSHLKGGQVSSCFIGGRNAAFTGEALTAWKTAGIKTSFVIAVTGIRAEGRRLGRVVNNLNGVALPGGGVDKLADFMDGLDNADMAALYNYTERVDTGGGNRNDYPVNKNRIAHEKIVVTLLTGAQFNPGSK